MPLKESPAYDSGSIHCFMSCSVEDLPIVRVGLEQEAAIVGGWLRAQGLGDARCKLLIGAFSQSYVESLPLPKWKFRTGNFNTEHRVRNLWYRNCAQLLWWGDRVLLPPDIHLIMKYKVSLTSPNMPPQKSVSKLALAHIPQSCLDDTMVPH